MRADFYLIARPRFLQAPLKLVCELTRKCYATGQFTVILARDLEQAEELDELLWAFDDDAYLPHQIAGIEEDQDEVTPVLIVPPALDTPQRPLVINLRQDAYAGSCERVLEVVPADPAARAPLRQRWRQYQARGFALNKHDM